MKKISNKSTILKKNALKAILKKEKMQLTLARIQELESRMKGKF